MHPSISAIMRLPFVLVGLLAFPMGGAVSIGSLASAQGNLYKLSPTKDNTLIQNALGALSDGAGPNFRAGRIGVMGGGTLRRGVIAFDVAGTIPAGATIGHVILSLHMSATVGGDEDVSLHALTSDWGEGTSISFGGMGAPSTPGDATWIHTFFPGRNWTTAGADFVAEVSATTTIGGIGPYTWSSLAMVADVQGWLDSPFTNNGWILVGDEITLHSVKAFHSRENGTVSLRPQLLIYTGPADRPKHEVHGGPLSPGGTITPLVATRGSRLRIDVSDPRGPSAAGVIPAVVIGGRIITGLPWAGDDRPPYVEVLVPNDIQLAGQTISAQGLLFDPSPSTRTRFTFTRAFEFQIE